MLRKHYTTVFPEEEFQFMDLSDQKQQMDKIYKIKYSLNMLPFISRHVVIHNHS